ncbi:MAG: ribulose-phosphate 3-epimerase [Clostridia bacterium]|nr:ribulose-phosphate 3-epimerase [Clostridia bacterium]
MVEISTSVLGVNKENSIKTFYDLEVAGTDYYHIDVMDGKFVEQNTEEKMYTFTNEIKQMSNIPLDVHFMVENIKENIDRYLTFKPHIITFHLEACRDKEEVKKYIKYLQENEVKCGISIKPNTKVEEVFEFLPYLHLCLIMTVEPGKGGQKLIPETVEKVRTLKKYIEENNLDTYIEVDGGINKDTVNLVKEAGADIIVAGSAIISAENYKEVIDKLKE